MIFFLSLGSNIEPEKNIPRSLELLKKQLQVEKISSVYETEPVGPAGDKKFWNLALSIRSDDDRKTFGSNLRKLEEALGRKRDPVNKFLPRTIDIDLLPQPDYQNQAFIMIPLAEIAPRQKDPETGKTFEELAEVLRLKEMGRLQKIDLEG
ncbi:MAG: 2-amino-4-hydroxy-6-hydroxymethyldihydropteridine diphosphokinase [Candidatus Omnitrophica bacterium]|nr:2-amino-4-hydroxy-6-hydroxymethyldihydropteridine diphosphokinase [Candidatus Omnitrophota bacterium]